MIVILISVIFHKFISNFKVENIFGYITNILAPFIYGLIIAYIINSGMRTLENKVFGRINYLNTHKKMKRSISIATTYIILLGAVFWIIGYIAPEVILSIQNIIDFFKRIDITYIEYILESSFFNVISPEISEYITNFIENMLTYVVDSVKYIPDMVNAMISGTVSVASYLLDVILGLVIAFYMLMDKEVFAEEISKILYVIFNKKRAEKIIDVAKESNTTFESFFIGKFIDSFIIGIIFFVGCLFIKPGYSLLLSLIIGVTNMIPYFGPFIGAVPVVLITLLSNPLHPLKALWIIIFIFILQQFDGIILGPKILGDSIGVKPIGIIFAIIIGGALFGPLGMFFGVPIFAVILTMLRSSIDKKYDYKFNENESEGE